jgi:ABC-type glycerol-3-phosphate transport system permease component
MSEHTEPLFEIAPRVAADAPVRRHAPTHWRALLMLTPAAVLTTAVLIGPLVATVVASFTVGRGGLGNYRAVFHDPAIRHAIGDSLRWLAFAPLVCLAGLAVAWPTRRQRRPLIGLLAAPVAVSALVTGAAFRLLATGVDPALLGSGWIWVVLGLAFVWQWLGLTAVVFRASMTGIPRDLLRVARAFGAGRLRQAGAVMLPALFPAGALVLILVLVTAARVFELVLAVAPGSVQDQVDVVGVHLWRFGPVLGAGESAALAVLLFLLVAAVALAGLGGLRREWPTVRDPAPSSQAGLVPEPRVLWPAWSRRLTRPAAVLVGIVWLVPLAALVLTSLHIPRAAAGGAWWGAGWGWGSYQAAFADGQLLPTLGDTTVRVLFAAALLLVLAVPAAYALARGDLPQPATRGLIALTAVLAVLPPQVVAPPLGYILDHLQLLGAATPLLLVHVAFSLPLATLLLRKAFAAVPRDAVRQLEPNPGAALLAVLARCWPALLAVAVLEVVLVWNDLLIGLLFGGTEAGAPTLVLFEQTRQFATSVGPLAADAVVITILPLVLVLATGKWLARGLAEGVRP